MQFWSGKKEKVRYLWPLLMVLPLLTCIASLQITFSLSLWRAVQMCHTKYGKNSGQVLNIGDCQIIYIANVLEWSMAPGLYRFPIPELLQFQDRCSLLLVQEIEDQMLIYHAIFSHPAAITILCTASLYRECVSFPLYLLLMYQLNKRNIEPQ